LGTGAKCRTGAGISVARHWLEHLAVAYLAV